jgi:dephospho-CoA kinase
VESAILYESGFDAMVDRVLFVDAPLDVRLSRAMRRDGASRQQIASRVARQDSERHREQADYVIFNDAAADEHSLLAQLASIPELITQSK